MTSPRAHHARTLASEPFDREAETLRALAHPKRLMILSELDDHGRTVTELADALGMTVPNTSQHLRVLREQRIVRAERSGQEARYRLTDPAFRTCCALVRSLLAEQAARPPRSSVAGIAPRVGPTPALRGPLPA